jgi:hypothetical protein
MKEVSLEELINLGHSMVALPLANVYGRVGSSLLRAPEVRGKHWLLLGDVIQFIVTIIQVYQGILRTTLY